MLFILREFVFRYCTRLNVIESIAVHECPHTERVLRMTEWCLCGVGGMGMLSVCGMGGLDGDGTLWDGNGIHVGRWELYLCGGIGMVSV